MSLIGLAILLIIFAVIAYALGARNLAWFSTKAAKILIGIFVILVLLALLFGGTIAGIAI